MKAVLLSLLLAGFLFSCEEKKEETAMETPKEDPAMEQFRTNVETTKKMIDAFIEEDTTAMAMYVTDDFIWSPPSVGRDSLSRSEWISSMQSFMDSYDEITLTDPLFYAGLSEEQQPNGDVRAYGLWKSKFAESGKDQMLKWYSVFFFNEEGKIAHQAEWYDTADLSREIE
ncbi:MAG: hypothetical protein HKN61_01365 [Flavobacteriaceae bacterium]|nr:hypothetical protein [Flavobacteriaceae bacterium]